VAVSRRALALGVVVLLLVAAVAAAAVELGDSADSPTGRTRQAGPAGEANAAPKPPPTLPELAASLKRPPRAIVMVVFDELPLTSLLEPGDEIDAARYPSFAELARSSIWFRNATAVHDSTALAVPAILEGRYPRPGLGSDYASHPRNLFTLLAPRYELHVSEEATGLCPPSLCEPTPGTTLSHLGKGRVPRFEQWLSEIDRRERPALWFKHVLFPHVPWQYLPSGLSYRRRPSEPIPGLNSRPGFGDPGLVKLSYQRHLLQVGFTDRLLGRLIAQLRRTGLWRRAMVVVVADHGIGFHVGVDRRTVTRGNVQDLAPVPLFVKLPGQPRGLTVDKHVETIDLLPTILRAARIGQPAQLDGRSLLKPAPRRQRQVTVFHRIGNRLNTLGGRYTFPARVLERRRDAAVRHKLALFGSGGGREPRRMFEVGPYPELVGRELSELERLPGRPTTRIDQAQKLRRVDPASGFVPAELTATIPHGRPGGGRPVAVAVNGRIAAVGSTFSLAGTRPECLAVVIPGWALRRGANEARAFAIVKGGAALRPL
jgi:sulfatase-like protein